MGFDRFRMVWTAEELKSAREGDALPIARDLLGGNVPGGWGPERLRKLLEAIGPALAVWREAFNQIKPEAGSLEHWMRVALLEALGED